MLFILSVVVLIYVGFNLATADFRSDGLALHNQYRVLHHTPPLELSLTLNEYTQGRAQNMANADVLNHSTGNYGENVYQSGNATLSDSDAMKDATKLWYNEASKYNYDQPGFTMETGHFTQVVWKNSKYLGLGVARSLSGRIYVCGSYDPRGNCQGEFATNVLKI